MCNAHVTNYSTHLLSYVLLPVYFSWLLIFLHFAHCNQLFTIFQLLIFHSGLFLELVFEVKFLILYYMYIVWLTVFQYSRQI